MTHLNKQLIPVSISEITQATPKIKIFKLTHNKKDFAFSPGQWIDLYAPISGKNIGGYTIISNPKTTNYIELAIRESDHHPVTIFMHEKAMVGSLLHITEGQGRFFIPLDLESEMYKLPLVFIAGGIGVTPLLSMMRWLKSTSIKHQLLYSASYEKDLILKSELDDNTHFTVTKDPHYSGDKTRINISHLSQKNIDFLNTHFFICGPKEMIDSLSKGLELKGAPKEHLHFEKWW